MASLNVKYESVVNRWEIQLQKQLKEKAKEKDATQTELDDLLMVFGDLEEKVEKYKVRYKAPQLEPLLLMSAETQIAY